MKKMTITIVVMLLIFGSIFAQTPKAEDILKKVDAVVNAPQDQEIGRPERGEFFITSRRCSISVSSCIS